MKKYFSIILLVVSTFGFSSNFVLAEGKKEEKTKEKFIYDDHVKRDPLMPLVTSTGEIIKFNSEISSTDLALEGIMYAPNGNGIAMINGKLLNIGDAIGPFTVKEITQYHVILTKGSKEIKLKLKKGD